MLGSIGTWISSVLKTLIEHYLDERTQIRAEKRAEAGQEAERQRSMAEKFQRDEDRLLMYRTQLKGTTDLVRAALVVDGIHNSLSNGRSICIAPLTVCFWNGTRRVGGIRCALHPERFAPNTLDELKRGVDYLQVCVSKSKAGDAQQRRSSGKSDHL